MQNSLAELVRGQIEDEDGPAAVLAWAKEYQGKPLRANQVPEGFRVRRQYGMTHLENREQWANQEWHPLALSILIEWREKHVTVPTPDELADRNTCYYEARQERNLARRAFLAGSGR